MAAYKQFLFYLVGHSVNDSGDLPTAASKPGYFRYDWDVKKLYYSAAGVWDLVVDGTNVVLKNQANSFGSFFQTFVSGFLRIAGSSGGFHTAFANSVQTGNFNLTIPVLTGNDTFMTRGTSTLDHLQDVNVTSPVKGQTLTYNGTNFINMRPSLFPSSNINGNRGRKWGTIFSGGSLLGLGCLSGMSNVTPTSGGPFNAGFTPMAYADKSKALRWTLTGGVAGNKIGMRVNTTLTMMGWHPRLKAYFRLNAKADSIFKIGFNSNGGDFVAGDDPFNAAYGLCFGKITDATNSNWVVMHNDNVGATVFKNVGPAFSAVAADNNIHSIEFLADDANSQWLFSFDDGAYQAISADIPTQQIAQGFAFQVEAVGATNPTFDIYWIEMETD